MPKSPRLFISYSWSTPEHEQWVLELAEELVESGVDVILDKWDLREGHDSVAFMEQMVTDPSISKVVLICDQLYATKADGRSGGVGTETQIISAEVYAKQDQEKFVAVIAEKNSEGKPYLPTYYKSRIYVDMSESDRYSENFDKLLRWIFDKPLYVRPELGRPPLFVVEPEAPTVGASSRARRAIEGIKNDKAYARGALHEYLTVFAENMERFRIGDGDTDLDERVVASIEQFTPARNEYIEVLVALAQYSDGQHHAQQFHRFLESLLPYLSRPSHINRYNESDFDNFRFIVQELFLYTVAILLREERIEAATYLLSQPYFIPANADHGANATATYAEFRQEMRSLDVRNTRLKTSRLSIRSNFFEQRSKSSGVQFRHVMQADFVCFFRSDLTSTSYYDGWWPDTLLYATRHHGPFELFARASSRVYLSRVIGLLGVTTLDEIKTKLEAYAKDRSSLPRWKFESFSPAALLGVDQLGSRA